MGRTEWLEPLQQILEGTTRMTVMSADDWRQRVLEAGEAGSADNSGERPECGDWVQSENAIWMLVDYDGREATVLELDRDGVGSKERELISWTLKVAAAGSPPKPAQHLSESESFALKLSDWVQKQLESDQPVYSLPDQLTSGSRLYREMIPFLLVAEQSGVKRAAAYIELEKLLRSFLSEDVLLIPLKNQEWLIWGPVSLLKDEELDLSDSQEEESIEDSLASIASGLHEMLASEWLGECHLAVLYPVSPLHGMVEATMTLRETINLGRKFHVGTNIHLPWMLQLERLLNAIPESHRTKYLEQALKRTDLFVESEMLSTLETFFYLDCNVSETAKKLYIHRNTLLYRLDKLKQETGLDVRQFRDAVLVKVVLLLYKVTKRN